MILEKNKNIAYVHTLGLIEIWNVQGGASLLCIGTDDVTLSNSGRRSIHLAYEGDLSKLFELIRLISFYHVHQSNRTISPSPSFPRKYIRPSNTNNLTI